MRTLRYPENKTFGLRNQDELLVMDHKIITRRADAAEATRCSHARSSSAVQLSGRPSRQSLSYSFSL